MFVLSIIKYMQINTAVKIFLSPNRWQQECEKNGNLNTSLVGF